MTNAPSGISLKNLLEQAPLPAAQVSRHALQMAMALRSAHESGRIVGILDPSRIYLNAGGAVIDAAGEAPSAYAAPELLAGARPDVRSDVFGFGAIVHQMLTGVPPFAGTSAPETAPSGLSGSIPGEPLPSAAAERQALERVILQCLENNPNRRWQSARAICMELRLLNGAARRQQTVPDPRRSLEALVREQVLRIETEVGTRMVSWERGVLALQQMTAEIAARIGSCEQGLAGLQGAVQQQQEEVHALAGSVEQKFGLQTQAAQALQGAVERTECRLNSAVDSIGACERTMVEIRGAGAESAEALQASIQALQERLGSQSESIEVLRAAVGQTDDLLERMVDTIDSLQSFVFERTAELASA